MYESTALYISCGPPHTVWILVPASVKMLKSVWNSQGFLGVTPKVYSLYRKLMVGIFHAKTCFVQFQNSFLGLFIGVFLPLGENKEG